MVLGGMGAVLLCSLVSDGMNDSQSALRPVAKIASEFPQPRHIEDKRGCP